jgi:hypothetical protein
MKFSLFGILNDPGQELRPVASPRPRPYKENVGRSAKVWEILAHDGKSCKISRVVMKCIIVAAALIPNHIPEPRGTYIVFDQIVNLAALALEDRLTRPGRYSHAHYYFLRK